MKIISVHQKKNPLLKRVEITFELDHGDKRGTPTRSEVKASLAEALNVTSTELIYIKKMTTQTGTTTLVGEVHIYDSIDQAKLIEPDYILTRNENSGQQTTGQTN